MESLSLESIYYIGQTIAAIAVIGSLFYLARQIRFAHESASDFTRQGRVSAIQNWMLVVAGSDELTRCWGKATDLGVNILASAQPLADALGLTPEEAAKTEWLCMYWWWTHWAQFSSTKTSKDVLELRIVIERLYSVQPMAAAWQFGQYRNLLDPSFVRFVNQALSGTGS